MTVPEHILTLDLGTGACKASLFAMDGSVAAQRSVEYPTLHPEPAAAEQDPSDWWDAAVRGCAALPAEGRRRVAAVGLSSHRGGVVPMDADLRPLARCIIWMDQRSAGEIEAFVRAFGQARVHEVTASSPTPSSRPARFCGCARTRPTCFAPRGCTCSPGTTCICA